MMGDMKQIKFASSLIALLLTSQLAVVRVGLVVRTAVKSQRH